MYTCTVDGLEGIFNAPRGSFRLEENGPEDLFFVPLTAAEKAEEINRKASTQFVEPKIKWEKSKAKKNLYNLIMEGDIPDTDSESEDIEAVYLMDPEFLKYDYFKFKTRLSTMRSKIAQLNRRADDDWEAYQVFISIHTPSKFSKKGYIQWQGSTSQELLWDDLELERHLQMTPWELWKSRPEYQKEFPLKAFRSKLEQEIRTGKYLFTLEFRKIEKERKEQEKAEKQEQKEREKREKSK